MRVFLARHNAEQRNPHELVGIFAANGVGQLLDLVDECTDVDRVEVLELGPGGLFWSGSVDFHLPYRGEDPEAAPGFPAEANLSDWWIHAQFDDNERAWLPASALAFA